MGLSVVAEGIESDRSLRLLRVMGCDLLQGEHISKPLEPAAVQDFVARSARAPA
jgi:EAL domain-containing protein (putative c-di-GMP-specific phosphodiesterase class I)